MAGEVVPFDMGSAPRYANRTPRYTQDQNLLELGLSQAARRTGGQFFRVIGNPRRMFERIEAQLSGHYLLGVEVDPADPVEDRRRIEVTVERGGAEVRLRHGNAHARVLRELRPGEAVTGSVDERLMAMLRSPDAEPWLPLRVSTYAYPDGGGQARVTVTAEVGGNGVDAADVTLGYALLDTWGAVVSSGRRRMPGTAGRRRNDGAHEYTLPFTAAPGRYALRVAAVDGSGRGGSVEHSLRAGVALSDAPLAFGTLEVADAEAPGGAGPEAEAVVSSGEIAVSLDVHAESSWVFNRVSVAVEVARDEEGPALAQGEAPLRGRDDAPLRSASARLAVGELSPGRYVARRAGAARGRRGDADPPLLPHRGLTRIRRPVRRAGHGDGKPRRQGGPREGHRETDRVRRRPGRAGRAWRRRSRWRRRSNRRSGAGPTSRSSTSASWTGAAARSPTSTRRCSPSASTGSRGASSKRSFCPPRRRRRGHGRAGLRGSTSSPRPTRPAAETRAGAGS